MRFAEFNTKWNITSFSALFIFQNGINADSSRYGKGAKYISVGDIINNDFITYERIKGLVDIDQNTFEHYKVEYGDILFQRSSETIEDIGQANVYLDTKPSTFGGFVIRGKKISEFDSRFVNYSLKSPNMRKQTIRLGAGAQHYNIGQESLYSINMKLPSYLEQIKIANFLNLIDERINTQNKIIEDLLLQKKLIIHSIFEQLSNTDSIKIKDIISYEQPSRYIVENTDYVEKSERSIPVLTANQAFILGYTNEITGICDKKECIIFDDFTMDTKYVNFPFKVKSSAIKILTATDKILIKYFYEYIQFLNLKSEDHKRHYISEIEPISIPVPDINRQKEIVNKSDLFNEKIENEKAILKSYKKQKDYLLKNLFI